MTKQEYLNQVKEMLKECDAQFVSDILCDFEEHFEQGIASGKTEAEVAESLGDLCEWIDEVKQEHAKKQLPEVMSVKDNSEEISCVKVNAGSIDVEVIGGTDDITWHLRDRWAMMNVHNYDVKETRKDETLILDVSLKENPRFHIAASHIHFVLAIPHDLEEVHVLTSSGDIDVKNLETDVLNLTSKSGDVTIHSSKGNLFARAQSGDIEVENCEGRHMRYITTSGDIDVKIDMVTELGVKSTSGEIEVKLEDADAVVLGSTSGDIEFEGDPKALNISTKSGDVEVTCTCPEDVLIETVSGDVEANLSNCFGMQCMIETASGDIELDFEELETSNCTAFKWGDGSTRVMIKTVSGDISLSEDD